MNRLWHSHLGIREMFDQMDRTCDQINEVFTQKQAERLAHEQKNLAEIAQWGLGVSIILATLALFLAWVGLYPEGVKSEFPTSGGIFVGPLVWGLLAVPVGLLATLGVWTMFRLISPNPNRPPANHP